MQKKLAFSFDLVYNIHINKTDKGAFMTRKDFQLIADVIKGHTDGKDDHVMRGFALSMAVELNKTNSRFDKVRFLKACGVA